nr:MAG TPA: hypothetical protein [Caudoviricetes sp.]
MSHTNSSFYFYACRNLHVKFDYIRHTFYFYYFIIY